MHEQQVAVEPMETIVEVSEHSRTTSADSHRTEQVTNFYFHFYYF